MARTLSFNVLIVGRRSRISTLTFGIHIGLALALVAFAVVGIAGALRTLDMWTDYYYFHGIQAIEQRRNQTLRQDLASLYQIVDRLQAKTMEWFAFDDRVRLVFDLNPVSLEERMLGVGGGAPREAIVDEQFDLLRRRAEYQEFRFGKTREELLNKVRKWSRTPTIWPLGGRVSSGYGYRIHPVVGYGSKHEGLDIAAPSGTPVRAPAYGVVEKCDRAGQYGNLVVIRHGDGISTRYGHLRKILVAEGQTVKRNDPIGLVGQTGLATGPHLHYEVRRDNKSQNPQTFLLPTTYVPD